MTTQVITPFFNSLFGEVYYQKESYSYDDKIYRLDINDNGTSITEIEDFTTGSFISLNYNFLFFFILAKFNSNKKV
jgi:hypothetical protein